MSNLKEPILNLRQQGLTYNQIVDKLKCSKSTVSYYCGIGQKEKNLHRQRKNKLKQHPYKSKTDSFLYTPNKFTKKKIGNTSSYRLIYKKIRTFNMTKQKTYNYEQPKFTVDDVLDKFGENPICYLTGDLIDINKPRTYHFDHRIPRSRGGDNSLDNLEICTKAANLAKSNMTPDEFVNFCQKVINHHSQ